MLDLDASAYGLSHRYVSKKRGNPKKKSVGFAVLGSGWKGTGCMGKKDLRLLEFR
jgi:hypothetical protein